MITMNFSKKSNFRQLIVTYTIILLAITFSFGFINIMPREAKAGSLPLLNSFQHGFSNDISWNTTNLGGAASAKIIAGPWAMNGWSGNSNDWLTKFKEPANQEKVPYIYMYQVAGKARADWGLQDCNVGAAINNTLCGRGAEYIRQKSTEIAATYTNVANQIKQTWGTTRPLMIHMEPDFYQYASSASTQLNGPITQAQAHTAMNQWTDSIKATLPNAVLVMDISPWNSNLAGWSNGFTNFDYAGMVGKRFAANGDGSINPAGIDGKTYAQMSQITGKKLIINDAHGAGGAYMSYGSDWENRANVQARWNDGVVAVLMPPNNNQSLESTIQSFTQNPIPVGSIVNSSSSVTVSSTSSSSSSNISSSSSSNTSVASSTPSSSSSAILTSSSSSSTLTQNQSSSPSISSNTSVASSTPSSSSSASVAVSSSSVNSSSTASSSAVFSSSVSIIQSSNVNSTPSSSSSSPSVVSISSSSKNVILSSSSVASSISSQPSSQSSSSADNSSQSSSLVSSSASSINLPSTTSTTSSSSNAVSNSSAGNSTVSSSSSTSHNNSTSSASSSSQISSQSSNNSQTSYSSISIQSSNSSNQSSIKSSSLSSGSSNSSTNTPNSSSADSQSSSSQVSSKPVQNSWLVTFGDGQRAEIELLNSDCVFSLIRELPTVAKFLEFRGFCQEILVKTYWLDIDSSKDYKLVKFNPINNSKANFTKANIGREIKNGKYVVTSIHKIINNDEGDYDPTNGIWDPYTLELTSDNTPRTVLPLASNSSVPNGEVKVINLKVVDVNNTITSSSSNQIVTTQNDSKSNNSNIQLKTIKNNNNRLSTVRTGGYGNWLNILILPLIVLIYQITHKRKVLD